MLRAVKEIRIKPVHKPQTDFLEEGGDEMRALANVLPAARSSGLKTAVTKTTLYDLIEAINAEAEEKNDDLVPEIVFHLINSGQIKLNGNFNVEGTYS